MQGDSLDLGKSDVLTTFGKYFIPTLLGMLSLCAVTAVDGIFVGHGVGSDGIAAINICMPLYMVLTGVGLMVGAGCSVVASINLSRGKECVARINVTQALAFVTVVALIPTILVFCFPTRISELLGASPGLMQMTKEYIMWLAPSWAFQVWAYVALFTIRLDGNPKLAMWCTLTTSIVNTVLDWLFIFPFGWGIAGAAAASTISVMAGSSIAMIYLIFNAKRLRPVKLGFSVKSLKLSLRNICHQCKVGSSALLGEVAMSVIMFVGNFVFMHYLGDDGVGAFGLACYYGPFIFMTGNAITQSVQPIISYNHGLGLTSRTQSALRIALFTAVGCGLVVSMVFIFCPRFLVNLFIDPSGEAALLAIEGFPYFATGFICFIVNLTVVGYYQSIENVRLATFFAMLRGFIFLIPSFVIMPKLLGTVGIWVALSCSEMLTTLCILALFLFRQCRNKLVYKLDSHL